MSKTEESKTKAATQASAPPKKEMRDEAPPPEVNPPTVLEFVTNLKDKSANILFPGGAVPINGEENPWIPKNPEVNYQLGMENTLANVRKLSSAYRWYPQFQPAQVDFEETMTKWNLPEFADALRPLEGLVVYYFSGGPFDMYAFAGMYQETLITVHAATRRLTQFPDPTPAPLDPISSRGRNKFGPK